MRKRLSILAAAVLLLTLVLAIPASASKAVEISGTWTGPSEFWDDEVEIGNTCHVTGASVYDYDGSIDAVYSNAFRSVAKGVPCPGGPGTFPESYHEEGRFVGTVLGKYGAFVRTCHAVWRPPLDENNFTLDCVIVGTEGELANLHGHMTDNNATGTYTGSVHFD